MVRAIFPARCVLSVFLTVLALVPAGTCLTDRLPLEPLIGPEQAIALAMGTRPLAAEGEVGDNDFRISDMGGDLTYDAFNPDVAYNSQDNEYLVVWEGDDGTLTSNGEF